MIPHCSCRIPSHQVRGAGSEEQISQPSSTCSACGVPRGRPRVAARGLEGSSSSSRGRRSAESGTPEEALLNGCYLGRAFDKLGEKRPHHSSPGLQLRQRKFSQFRELCSS